MGPQVVVWKGMLMGQTLVAAWGYSMDLWKDERKVVLLGIG